MDWLRKNSGWLLLNVFAAAVLSILWLESRTYQGTGYLEDPLFEQSGRQAIRFLLFSLAMTPVHRVFGWRGAIKLRKPAGLWAFGFGVLHITTYIIHNPDRISRELLQSNYVILGIAGLSILALLATTSHQPAMRWLGKNWKRLHRLVYVAGILLALHTIIAASSTKRGYFRDNGAAYEFKLYLAILIVLLALRIPFVRDAARSLVQQPLRLLRKTA